MRVCLSNQITKGYVASMFAVKTDACLDTFPLSGLVWAPHGKAHPFVTSADGWPINRRLKAWRVGSGEVKWEIYLTHTETHTLRHTYTCCIELINKRWKEGGETEISHLIKMIRAISWAHPTIRVEPANSWLANRCPYHYWKTLIFSSITHRLQWACGGSFLQKASERVSSLSQCRTHFSEGTQHCHSAPLGNK